jgi:inner membrane protein
MDPLTHTATGLFLGRAGLNRWTPLAAPILMLAANAPDIDIVCAAGGSVSYLHYHRHLTHSLLAMPVMALLPVALVALVARKRLNWLGAYAASLIAVATHLLLDWTNVYGIRLLLPFSEKWFRLDLINVVDLWIWTALGLGVAVPFLARLVGSEITSGASRTRHHGRGAAWAALVFLAVYTYGRSVLHSRAVAVMESRIYAGADPLRTVAVPHFANPLAWRAVVETQGFYAVEDFNLAGDYDPTRATVYHKPQANPAIEAARASPTFQEFLRFSQAPLWRVAPVSDPAEGKAVDVVDMRFGTPSTPGFMASAILDANLRPIKTSLQYGRLRVR